MDHSCEFLVVRIATNHHKSILHTISIDQVVNYAEWIRILKDMSIYGELCDYSVVLGYEENNALIFLHAKFNCESLTASYSILPSVHNGSEEFRFADQILHRKLS